MSSVVTSNNILARDNRAPAPAVHEDGSNHTYRMFFERNQRIVDADTLPEILDVLIDNYSLMDPDAALQARINLARGVQLSARSTILANLSPEKESALTDWEWTVLNYGEADDTDPYGWGTGEGLVGEIQTETTGERQLDIWRSEVPLVLLETSYAPHTQIPRPISVEGDYLHVKNLIWLQPTEELTFLQSLSRIGFVKFGEPRATKVGE